MAAAGRHLPPDTVKYCLYPVIRKSSATSSTPPSATSDFLTVYVIESLGKLNPLLTGYIWQNEPFNLHVLDQHPSQEAHIQGQTNFGDNVDDEWFIVFLLMQLTKNDPDLVVTIEDSDGQFLLIEAADFLPKWLTPESSTNRLFLSRSQVHLIPKRQEPLPHGVPALSDALRVIRSSRYETTAPREIQAAIESRIRGFPNAIRKKQHVCRCYIPAAVAAILESDPYVISAAVRAFFYRDPIDLKACRVMKHFPPENRVMRNVKMSRCMYAQLMSQNHAPDPKIGWEIPSTGSRLRKAYDLGMKIACGFEILAATAEAKASSHSDEDDTISLIDHPELLDQDRRWRKYIRSLYTNEYFAGLTKGSKEYTGRVDQARKYFCSNVVPAISSQIDLASYSFLGKKILHCVKTLDVDYEKYRKQEQHLPPEDADKWMSVEPDNFDDFLKEKFLDPSNTQLSKLSESVPKAITDFVAMKSGLRGVEIPAKSLPTGKKSKDISKERSTSPTEGFDPESFANALKNVLTLKVPSDPEFTDSDMSDYSDEMGSESDIDSDETPDELDFLKNQRNKQKSKKNGTDIVSDMKSYMKLMDKELSATTIEESFDKRPPLAVIDDDDDDDEVDIGYNALKNMLASYKNEDGMPGPSSTILDSMAVFLPPDSDRNSNKIKH